MKRTAIMGFGNPVRSDDAVGIYVIEELKKKLKNKRHIDVFDMGTSSFEVLLNLKGYRRIIMVDAVINSSEPVGTLFKLPAEEVLQAPQDDPMVFLHGMKWNQALSYAKKILKNEYPNDINVYLIAIENTALEVKLSKVVEKAGNKIVNLIAKDLKLTYK